MFKKEVSPEKRRMNANKREKAFKKFPLKLIQKDDFNFNFVNHSGQTYSEWIKNHNKYDTQQNRLSFYKLCSLQVKEEIRKSGERELGIIYRSNQPDSIIREVKDKSKKQEFIEKHQDKPQLLQKIIKMSRFKPNLSLSETIFIKEYSGSDWFDKWIDDKGRNERKLTGYEKRIVNAHNKNPDWDLDKCRGH